MKSKANIIVGTAIIVVLAVAIGLFASSQTKGADSGGLQAVVHDADGNETKLSLSENQEFTARTSLGENIVVIEDGNVYVREADCPNQDCVHQGKISSPGRQIICLPHKLWIEVVGDENEGAADMDLSAVAGEGPEDANATAGEGSGDADAGVGGESEGASTAASDKPQTEDLDAIAR